MMGYNLTIKDDPTFYKSKVDLIRHLTDSLGMDKKDVISFMSHESVAYEWMMIDLMGNSIRFEDEDVVSLFDKARQLGLIE